VQRVHVSPALLDYVQALVGHTRESPDFANGLSPRAALALVHASRAWAFIADRKHVLPEDVQAVLASVVTHRLPLAIDNGRAGGWESAHRLMQEVAIP
jgi:MoxR-like ATPase